jgi:hypothetical protein
MTTKYETTIQNYVFSHNISPVSTLNQDFKYLTKILDDQSATFYYDTTIGFNFNFNGRTYRRIIILLNGAIILCSSTTQSASSIILRLFGGHSIKNNKEILTGTTDLINDAVLAPWFNEYVYSSYSMPSLNTPEEIAKFNLGQTEVFPEYFKGLQAGVWIQKNIPNTRDGQSTIVRWNVLVTRNVSPSPLTSYPVEFECQIFKNGNVKFAYNKLKNLSIDDSKDSKASIAVYTKFGIRDMSSVVKPAGEEYKFNGYVVSNGNLPENDLTLKNNWPGSSLFNAELLLQRYPEKRKTLPVIEILGKKFNNKTRHFDDRLTKIFSNDLISFPIGINRNYGNGTQISQFTVNSFSKDFDVNSYVHPKASDELMNLDDRSYISPFEDKDNLKHYFGHSKLNSFKFNFNLHYSTSMPSVSSSVYALDLNYNAFLMMQPEDVKGPILNEAGRVNWKPDDARAFSATGVHLVSSSIHESGATYLLPYTNEVSYSGFVEEISTNKFNKTLELNPEYNKQSNRIYVNFNNSEDFVLKRVDIDMSFVFGSDWFDDYTKFQFYSASSNINSKLLHFDCGGPAITVALYRQSSGSMELITKGLITHSNDYYNDLSTNSVKFQSETLPYRSLIIRDRMNFYATPSYIVDSNELISSELKKQINLQLIPKSYAGIKFLACKDYNSYDDIKSEEYIELNYLEDDIVFTNEIENGSRDKKGFNSSERSLSFETVSLSDQTVTENGLKIKNPYFQGILNETEKNYLNTYGNNARYMFVSNVITEKNNDYILRSNDKLVLLVSKTRPSIDKLTQQIQGTHTVKFVDAVKINLIGEYTKGEDKFVLTSEHQQSFNRETCLIASNENFDKNDFKRTKESTVTSRQSSSVTPGSKINRMSKIFLNPEYYNPNYNEL